VRPPLTLIPRRSCEARASKDASRGAVQDRLESATRASASLASTWGRSVGRGVDLYPPLLGRQLLHRRHPALGGRAGERTRPRAYARLYVHAKAGETGLLRTLRADRRRDSGGAADQGLVESEEGGLHSRRFSHVGGAFNERFESALVTLSAEPWAANWSVLRGERLRTRPVGSRGRLSRSRLSLKGGGPVFVSWAGSLALRPGGGISRALEAASIAL